MRCGAVHKLNVCTKTFVCIKNIGYKTSKSASLLQVTYMSIEKQIGLAQLFLREPSIGSNFKDFMKESYEELEKSEVN